MNPQDPLAALHPLREPGLLNWWPPAPGWWVLTCLILAGLIVAGFLLCRRYQRNAYRRTAQRQLLAIRTQYREHGDVSQCLSSVNALLKSVALCVYPRRQIAASSGENWLAVINEALPSEHQLQPTYLNRLYGAAHEDIDIENVLTAAGIWIRRHRVARHD